MLIATAKLNPKEFVVNGGVGCQANSKPVIPPEDGFSPDDKIATNVLLRLVEAKHL